MITESTLRRRAYTLAAQIGWKLHKSRRGYYTLIDSHNCLVGEESFQLSLRQAFAILLKHDGNYYKAPNSAHVSRNRETVVMHYGEPFVGCPLHMPASGLLSINRCPIVRQAIGVVTL